MEAIPSIQHSFSLATASDWRRLDKSYQMNVMRRLEETGEKDRYVVILQTLGLQSIIIMESVSISPCFNVLPGYIVHECDECL